MKYVGIHQTYWTNMYMVGQKVSLVFFTRMMLIRLRGSASAVLMATPLVNKKAKIWVPPYESTAVNQLPNIVTVHYVGETYRYAYAYHFSETRLLCLPATQATSRTADHYILNFFSRISFSDVPCKQFSWQLNAPLVVIGKLTFNFWPAIRAVNQLAFLSRASVFSLLFGTE